jgi:hypothetical protein
MIIRSAIAWLVFVIGASLIVAFVRPISDRLMPIPSVFVDRDMREATPTVLLPTLHGIATHYDAERNGETTWYTRAGIEFYGAAGPDLRKEVAHEWRNRYRVIVSSKKTGRAVIVWIVDFCECRGGDKHPKNDRLVDLAPAVWDALGIPLDLGVMPITIELLP